MTPGNNIKYIVGLVGKKGVGKDLFYLCCLELYIERKLTLPPVRFAFADALKKEVAVKHKVSIEELNQRKAEFRKELQDTGLARRKEDEDYWIGRVAWSMLNFDRKMFGQLHIPHLVIVTDVRFQNEAEWITNNLRGKLIRIRRSDLEEDFEDKHESETELEKIKYDNVIINEGKGRINLYKNQILDTLKQLGMTV